MRRSLSPGQPSWVVERELITSVGWFFQVRWAVGLAVLVLPWPASRLPGLRVEPLPLSLCGLLLLLANLFLFVLRRQLRLRADRRAPTQEERLAFRVRRAHLMLGLQVALDWGVTFVIVHWTGGIQSPLLVLLLVHVVLASTLLRSWECFLLAGLAVALTGGLACAYLSSWLQVRPLTEAYGPLTLSKAALELGAFALISFSIAWLATSLAARFRHREKVILALGENLELAFGRLQSLYGLARVITSILDQKELLARMAERVALSVGAQACLVQLLDSKTRALSFAAGFGLDQPPPQAEPEESGLIRRVLAGKSLFVTDLAAESDPWAVQLAQMGWRSLAAAPARGKEGVAGAIWTLCPARHKLGQEEASFLEAAGFHAGLAIENAMAWTALKDLQEAKAAFVQIITHELRSPVGVVLSLLRTLTSGFAGKLEPRQLDLLMRAQNRTDFLLELVNDLLDLAASRALPRGKADLAPVNLGQAAGRVAERHEVPAREKGLQLGVELPREPLLVQATPEAIDRILENLVANAIKYTPPGGRVSVEVRLEEEQALFLVDDTGIGIPRSALEKLGQEFYRAPNARKLEPTGTGLGLAITQDLIRTFHGSLAIQSEEGQGSRFTVRFPLL